MIFLSRISLPINLVLNPLQQSQQIKSIKRSKITANPILTNFLAFELTEDFAIYQKTYVNYETHS